MVTLHSVNMSSSEYEPDMDTTASSYGSAHTLELRSRKVPPKSYNETAPKTDDDEFEVISSSQGSTQEMDSQGTTEPYTLTVEQRLSQMEPALQDRLNQLQDLAVESNALMQQLQPTLQQIAQNAGLANTAITQDQFNDLINSQTSQSMIANAIARGIGAAASSAIVNAIFSSLRLPFQTASDTMSSVSSGVASINDATSAVNNVVNTVQQVRNELGETAKDAAQAVGAVKHAITKMQDSAKLSRSQAVLSDVAAPQHDGTTPKKLKHRLTEVVFGDNSVTMIGVAEQPAILSSDRTVNKTPELWQQALKKYHLMQNLFAINGQGQWMLSSNNAWYDGAGEQVHAALFEYHVLHSHANHAAAHHIIDPVVTAAPSVRVNQLAEMAIADYMTAGNINDRTVQNTLNGFLHPANISVLRDIAFKLGEPIYFYDNTMIYAKLLHYTLLRQIMAHQQVVPIANAWVAQVDFVNLDDANLNWQAVTATIERGDIVLVDGYDWVANEPGALQLIQLLSTSAHPLGLPQAGVAPISRTTTWPQVHVTVLIHGAAPALPAAALIDHSIVLNFAKKLASSRNEQDQLLKGLYCAMEMVSTRLMHFAEDAGDKHPLSPFFGPANYTLPKPRDFNFMARFLNLRPQAPSTAVMSEIDAYSTRSNEEVCSTVALYAASIQAAATTYFAGANVTTQQLLNRATNANNAIDPNLRKMFAAWDQPINQPSIAETDADAAGRVMIRNLAMKMFGISFYSSLWWGTPMMFAPNVLGAAAAAQTYHGIAAGLPPRFSTLFGLTTYVEEYPYEWGCSERGAHFDITNEVVRLGPVAQRGWRAVLGDHRYNRAILENRPFILNMYGWQVLQCLTNRAQLNAQPDGLMAMSHQWQQGIPPDQWNLAEGQAFQLPAWNMQANCYEPCTFLSFDWANSALYAPRLHLAQQWWQPYSRHDGKRATCGFDALDRDMGATSEPQVDMMDMSFLHGMSAVNLNPRSVLAPNANAATGGGHDSAAAPLN